MVEIVGGVAVLVLLVLFPLMAFAGQLARVKRTGLGEYGGLAQRYVREFDAKWLRGGEPGEPLLGSADIQSLADLANSFQVIREMRLRAVLERDGAAAGDRHAGAGGAAAADDDLVRRADEAAAERRVLNAAPAASLRGGARRRCRRHLETAAQRQVQVDALDALLGLHPDQRRARRRQRQLPLLDESQVGAANPELRLHHRQRLLVVVDAPRARISSRSRAANLGGQGRFDLSERAQPDRPRTPRSPVSVPRCESRPGS